MSKHKYSNKYELPTSEEIKTEEVETEKVETEELSEVSQTNVEDNSEHIKKELIYGIVSNCEKLNIRRQTSINPTNVVCIINKGDKVRIIDKYAAPNWYKICTNVGIEGYCMAEFIELK